MKKTRVELNDAEKRELEWWCRHHKESADYLAFRIMQYFEDPSKDMEGIIKVAARNVLKENKN